MDFQHFVDCSPDPVVALDSDGRVCYVNKSAACLLDLDRELVHGKLLREVVPGSCSEVLVAGIKDALPLEPVEAFWETTSRWYAIRAMPHRGGVYLTFSDITALKEARTERKRMKHALHQQRERLNVVLANLPVILYSLDRDGVYVLSEGRELALLNRQPGEMVGRSLFDVYRDRPDICENVRRGLRGEQSSWTVELNGYHLENVCTPLHDDAGEIAGLLGVVYDITERVRSRTFLQQYKDIFDSTEQGIVVARYGETAMWMMNAAFARMHGYTIEELKNKSILELIPQDKHETAAAIMRATVDQGHYACESVQRRKDGSSFPVWLDATAVRDEQGRTRYGIIFVTDLTERKRAEQALQASEAQCAAIIRSAMDAVVSVDENQRIVVFNPAAERIFGYAASEIMGQPLSLLLPQRFHEAHDGHMVRFASRGDSLHAMGARGDLTARRKDGSEFPIEATISRVTTGEGHHFTAIVRDVTERRRAETERERHLQEKAAAVMQQRVFLREVLYSVTEGKLRLCDSRDDLPAPLPPVSPTVPLSAAALSSLRRLTQEVADRAGLPETRGFDLVTATSECAMNAFQHGGGNPVAHLHSEPGKVQVWIEDQGTGIAVSDLPRATLLKGHSGGNSFGHGFTITLQATDAVYLLTSAEGTIVVLEQTAETPEPIWMRQYEDAGWDDITL